MAITPDPGMPILDSDGAVDPGNWRTSTLAPVKNTGWKWREIRVKPRGRQLSSSQLDVALLIRKGAQYKQRHSAAIDERSGVVVLLFLISDV